MAQEARGLLSESEKETVRIVGTDFERNGHPWHVVIVFPLCKPGSTPDSEESKKWFDAPMSKPIDLWKNIFTVHCAAKEPDIIKEGVTRKQFNDAVFKEICTILGGRKNGMELGTHKTIDGDELFLLIGVTDKKARHDLANAEEFLCKIKRSAYEGKELLSPTDCKEFEIVKEHGREVEKGKFVPSTEKDLDGEEIPNAYFIHVPYSAGKKNILEDPSELDCIRLARRRIKKFIHMEALLTEEVCLQWFPVHHWEAGDAPDETGVNRLFMKGWNNLTKVTRWPSENRSDPVAAYFGAEIGFFFHWLNMFTRYLGVPAFLGIITFTLREGKLVDRIMLNYLSMIFAVILICWSSVFVGKYVQAKKLKQMKWGMDRISPAHQEVRTRVFKDSYRDTILDNLQHFLHWSMVVFFIAETLWMVAWCTRMQKHAMRHPEGETMGISNEYMATYPKYIITINIKLVDKVWGPISNMLSKRENWRTPRELQDAQVVKMFIVKLFVFYYPFFYEIVIKPQTAGCGPHHSHHDLTGCVDSLNDNLLVFFISQVFIEAALLIVGLLMTAYHVRSEKSKHPDKPYTYLELQAKSPPYADDELNADMLNCVVTYGYIVLFGVSLPFMCMLGFLTNFVMIRLLAYKVSFAFQRPIPKAVDGIGAWERVISTISYLAVPANTYIAVFTLKALRDEPMAWKLFIFILVENLGLGLKMAIEGLISDKSTAHKRIEEYNADVVDDLFDEPDPEGGRIGKADSKVESPYSAY